MKKITALILSLALVFSLAACGGSKTDAPAQDNSNDATASSGPNSYGYDVSAEAPLKIVSTSALNATHCCYAGFYQPFMDLVTEMSDGKITWETYMSGELVEGGKEYDALRDGVADVAMPLTPSMTPLGSLPAMCLSCHQGLYLRDRVQRICGSAE